MNLISITDTQGITYEVNANAISMTYSNCGSYIIRVDGVNIEVNAMVFNHIRLAMSTLR